MEKMIELRNDFHHSTARIKEGVLTRRTVRRVRNALCGIEGCTCGGNLSERGNQTQADGADIEIVPLADGQVEVRRVYFEQPSYK